MGKRKINGAMFTKKQKDMTEREKWLWLWAGTEKAPGYERHYNMQTHEYTLVSPHLKKREHANCRKQYG